MSPRILKRTILAQISVGNRPAAAAGTRLGTYGDLGRFEDRVGDLLREVPGGLGLVRVFVANGFVRLACLRLFCS